MSMEQSVEWELAVEGKYFEKACPSKHLYLNTVKPVLNGPFIKRNFVLNGNIFRSRDYRSIAWLNGNLASVEKYSGPLRFRLRQVLLYLEFI
jgi:hypothetical protein